VLLLVEHTTVMVHLAAATHVVAVVVATLVGQKIAKALASLTMFMSHGLAMVTVTMVHTFLPIMVVMNAQLE
jgi:hypothetical protein